MSSLKLLDRINLATSANLEIRQRAKIVLGSPDSSDFPYVATGIFPSNLEGMKRERVILTPHPDVGLHLRVAAQQETVLGFHTWEDTRGWMDRPLRTDFNPDDLRASLSEDPKLDLPHSSVDGFEQGLDLLDQYQNAQIAKYGSAEDEKALGDDLPNYMRMTSVATVREALGL